MCLFCRLGHTLRSLCSMRNGVYVWTNLCMGLLQSPCHVRGCHPLRMSIAHTAWNCFLRVCAALPVQTVVFDKKKGAVNQTIQTLINRVRAGEVADMYVVLRVRVLVSWGAAVCACAEFAWVCAPVVPCACAPPITALS